MSTQIYCIYGVCHVASGKTIKKHLRGNRTKGISLFLCLDDGWSRGNVEIKKKEVKLVLTKLIFRA